MRSFESIMKHSGNENINGKDNNIEKVDSMEKLPKPVYYIESPNDDTVLVGINVTINHDRMGEQEISIIRWYDTSHTQKQGKKMTILPLSGQIRKAAGSIILRQ